ncbi:MAG TPA: cell wall-binding repeat-containing protein [Acidimicrobiales bacterium]|nr:cell wall-binding repeat-containing protein [Acidimicrobiales bacterium]
MHSRRTSRRTIALLLVVSTLLLPAPGAEAQSVGQLRATPNQNLGDYDADGRGRDRPGLAVNPADASHVVETELDLLAGNCNYNVSFDAGRTWPVKGTFPNAPGFPPANSPYPNPMCDPNGGAFDGAVAFGSGGNVYSVFASRPTTDAGQSLIVVRSTDGGRTFTPVVAALSPVATTAYRLPEIGVHRNGGAGGADRLYVSTSATLAAGNRAMAVVSNDGGLTWSPPVDVSGNVASLEPSVPVVAPNGNAFIAYRGQGTNSFIFVAKSVTAGATWTRVQAAPVRAYDDQVNAPFTNSSFPRMAVDPNNGRLYVVYMQGPPFPGPGVRQDHFIHPDVDVLLIRSADLGATWDTPIRVNDDPVGSGAPGVGPAQRHPRVLVSPDSRVDVVWQDRRHAYRAPTHSHLGNGEARMGDTYYDYSLDGGQSFNQDRRISDKTQNLDVGYDHYGQAYWSWGPALAHIGDGEVLFVWVDSREGNFDNENQDVYLGRMNLRAPAEIPVERIPESVRPALSVELSKWAYQGGSQAVLNVGFSNREVTRPVIVNERDPAAALAGAVLSRAHLGPLLASPGGRLSPEQRAEVDRMDPIGAFVIGSEASLSAGVVSDLVAAGVPGDQVTRLAGASPADTARLVALNMDRRTDEQRAGGVPAFDAAIVVNANTKEAAAAAGLAAHRRLPILFVETGGIPQATLDALAALNITTTLVAGGTGAVSDAVLGSLPGARRLAGDVYAASEAFAGESAGRLVPTNIVYVADGEQPVDAALTAAAAARAGGLVLLTPGADPVAAEAALNRLGLRNGVDRLIVVRSFASLGGPGYRLVAKDGGVFAFGGVQFFGSTGGIRLNRPMVGVADTPSNLGYWLVAEDGGVFAFGDAVFHGTTARLRLVQPIVAMAPTPSGGGYWLVAKDGGVFAFGDAQFFGSTGGRPLNQPVVSLVPTPTGLGYWLVAADGGVFAFGDARFQGSTGGTRLNRPVVGATATPTGNGYLLVASDGGVFAFGDAVFSGSTGAIRLNQPVVGMDTTPTGRGYYLVASDGGVFAFGDAVFSGSTGSIRLNQPVVGIAAAD